jgi:hypothetical protein
MNWKIVLSGGDRNAESAPEKGWMQGADLHVNYQ